MTNRNSIPIRSIALAALASAVLAACTTTNSEDDKLSRIVSAPGKYVLFDCQALAQTKESTLLRLHELEALMKKAETTSSGVLVSNMAYRPEYLSVRGDLRDLNASMVERKCKSAPSPAAAAPKRASDSFIR